MHACRPNLVRLAGRDSACRHLACRHLGRRGAVSLYFILFLIVTVPTMFVAIDLWRIAEGKIQQQRFCDAVAHAAANMLNTETTGASPYSKLLYGDPTDIQNLCQTDCIGEADNYAAKNFVDGVALVLDHSTVNKDVKFGKFDFNAATPTFTLIDPTTASQDDRRDINAVRIEAFRTTARSNAVRLFGPAWTLGAVYSNIVTRTTAVLDRRVIGFRIQKNWASTPVALGYQNVPMVPVGLLNDATPTSWAQAVEAPADKSKTKIPYGTMTVLIPTSSAAAPSKNSQLLRIGVTAGDQAAFDDQILNGITAAQMSAYNPTSSDMILDSTTFTVNVPQFTAPKYDATMQANFVTLMNNQTERVWPLYETLSGANVVVTGFVAARITAVSSASDGDGLSYISLTLQPTLFETPTAFTDYSTRYLKAASSPYSGYSRIVNPYICRVRLVD